MCYFYKIPLCHIMCVKFSCYLLCCGHSSLSNHWICCNQQPIPKAIDDWIFIKCSHYKAGIRALEWKTFIFPNAFQLQHFNSNALLEMYNTYDDNLVPKSISCFCSFKSFKNDQAFFLISIEYAIFFKPLLTWVMAKSVLPWVTTQTFLTSIQW